MNQKIKLYVASPLDEKGLELLAELTKFMEYHYPHTVEVIHASTHGKLVDFKGKDVNDQIIDALNADKLLVANADLAFINFSKVEKYNTIDQGVLMVAGMISMQGVPSVGYSPETEPANKFLQMSMTEGYYSNFYKSLEKLNDLITNYI